MAWYDCYNDAINMLHWQMQINIKLDLFGICVCMVSLIYIYDNLLQAVCWNALHFIIGQNSKFKEMRTFFTLNAMIRIGLIQSSSTCPHGF